MVLTRIASIAFATAISSLFAAGLARSEATLTDEQNMDRPGGDYDRLDSSAPGDCAARCQSDLRCRAFTFVRWQTIQGPQGQCWLKSSVPAPRPSDCCISGVKVQR